MTTSKQTSRISEKPTTPADNKDGEKPAETPTQVETAASPPPPVQQKFVLKEQTVKYDLDTLISPTTHRPIKHGVKPSPVPIFWCDICSVKLSPPMAAIWHFNGKGHLAQLSRNKNKQNVHTKVVKGPAAAVENGKGSLKRPNPEGKTTSTSEPAKKVTKTEEVTKRNVDDPGLKCEDCNLTFGNYKNATEHFKGRRHLETMKKKMERQQYNSFKKMVQRSSGGEGGISDGSDGGYRNAGNNHNTRSVNNSISSLFNQPTGFGNLRNQTGAFGGANNRSTGFGGVNNQSTGFGSLNTQSTGFGSLNTQSTGFGSLNTRSTGFGSPNSQYSDYGGLNTRSTAFGGLNNQSSGFGSYNNQSKNYSSLNSSGGYNSLNKSPSFGSLRGNYDDLDQRRNISKSTSFGSLLGNYDNLNQRRNVSSQSNYGSSLGSLGNNRRR